MLRLSKTKLAKLDRLRIVRWRNHLSRRGRRGDHRALYINVIAPETLSFRDNPGDTIRFLDELRAAVFNKTLVKLGSGLTQRPVSLNLNMVKSISVPVAVVLSAELHRWSLSRKSGLRLAGTSRWTKRLRLLLTDLGSLDLLGFDVPEREPDPMSEVVILRLASGEKRDGEAVRALQTHIQALGVEFVEQKSVFSALDEAVLNCVDHGYIAAGGAPKYPYAGHRWWATSCYDPNNESLRFFVYDQGIGIPKSLPHDESFSGAVKRVLGLVGLAAPDADIIEAAFEVGRSRTNEDKRGKGLDNMHKAIRLAGAGYLRIMSGAGDVQLGPDGIISKVQHGDQIGGTLVEWCIPLSALPAEESQNA